MIGSLTGTIVERSSDSILLDVSGVGYLVNCSERTLAELPADGAAVRLYTDLQVREDLMQLFGFRTKKERELHKCLISVQGVGAGAAMAICGSLGADGAIQAVTLGDSDAIRSAKGVGPKLARRIVNELQSRVSALIGWQEDTNDASPADPAGGAAAAAPKTAADAAAVSEAHSALINLGYQQGEAVRAVAEAARGNPDAATEILIRESLLRLAPK